MDKDLIQNDIEFHHEIDVQLRYNDADMQGHVNNTVYFQYFNMGYHDYLRALALVIDSHMGIVVAHVECDFVSSVHIGDNVKVRTAVVSIGNKSFTIESQLVDADTGELRAKARYVMCSYDLDHQCAMQVPLVWIESMEAFELRKLRR
jgi:acyl-CoA thioester hydrolase